MRGNALCLFTTQGQDCTVLAPTYSYEVPSVDNFLETPFPLVDKLNP